MARDFAREQLPGGFVWNMVDYIPNLGAPLAKRGGWNYASNDVSGTSTGATYIVAGAYAEFSAGTKLVYITDNGKLGTISSGTASNVGTVVAPKQNPWLHRQKLVIPSNDGSTASSVKYYDGSSVGTLGGSPPLGQFGCVWRDYSVLANTAANPNYVYFGPAGDPSGTWDTTTGWFAMTYPVTGGVWPMRNAVLTFTSGHCERLRGTTPPPNTDLSREPVFDHGCLDARSLAGWGDNLVFANAEGVFLTDGATAIDLTAKGGMSRYWRDTLTAWTTSWTLAGGIFQNKYVLSVMNGSTFVDCLMCDLITREWTRHSNVKSVAFFRALGAAEKLYFGSRTSARLNELSTFWQPGSSYKTDGDGTNVTPIIETAYVRGITRQNRRYSASTGIETWKNIFGDYDLRDAASDTPTLQIAVLTSPEATSYTNLGTALPATTKKTRMKRDIGLASNGLAFKLTQSGPSSQTYLYSLETVNYARELGRLS